jgi:RNAse (barnase) inhibitor barstar
MTDLELWQLDGPALVVASATSLVSLSAVAPPTGTSVVAHLDGSRMREEYEILEQFATALRFPAYFGWNWNALFDCLRDLSWHPADRYLVIVHHAENVLKGKPEEQEILFSILLRASRQWANSLEYAGREGVSFRTLLIAEDQFLDELRSVCKLGNTGDVGR